MTLSCKHIAQIIEPEPVIEKTGVRLKRSIGKSTLDYLDPFLLFDDVTSGNSRDCEAGFPLHPHRGIETVIDVIEERGGLAHQTGIWLGINGMAVGGKRRITIQPELVTDGLLLLGIQRHQEVGIRKEKLIVEATLTASCIPVPLRGPLIEGEIRCRDADLPQASSIRSHLARLLTPPTVTVI